ncbi:MAG: dienelactone hydrolase family protein [Chloroflexota bacterium]
MCYDDKALPPVPPGTAGKATTEDLVLTASDGNRFAAYLAVPEQSSGVQVIIYPDVRGLHQFYKELATRFAEVGITAMALDYFGRTAGLTSRDESFEYMPHVQQITLDTFWLDVQATQDYLRDKFTEERSTFVVGFCIGGALTLWTGTRPNFGFAGLIPFYPGISRNFSGKGTILDIAERIVYPVLGLFGGADQGIPESAVHQLDVKLDTAGVEHQLVSYPGAPHSFFDKRATEFADASMDAWQHVLAFIKSHKHTY